MPDGSDAPPPTSWWQPQNWSLRVKLGVVVLVPVVLAVVLGVLRIADQAGVANDLAKVDRVVTAQGQVSELLRQLEAEREIAAGYVAANRQGDLGRYDQQAAAVDGTAGPLEQVVHDVGVDATTAAGADASLALGTLADIRGQVKASGLGAGAVIARYNDVVNPLVRLTDSLSRQIVAPEVGNLAAGVRALVVARNEASLQHSLTIAALVNPVPARADVALVQGADARYGEAIAQYQAALSRQQLDTYGQYTDSPLENTRTQLISQLANLPDAEPIDRAVLDRTFTDLRTELDKGERGVRGELSTTGLALQNDASNSAGISSVILLLALLLAALVVVLVARVLVRSLRTLRAAALDVANRRLPESVAAIRSGSGARPTVVPVPLRTTDEVGQVARAFDAVHGQAITLAAEQAALQSNVSSMFVNLSRRSQALVERQLQLIEQLESNEQDADQLSNLFQLDHLATRMRRNSENLLVLAGTNLTRRNTAPVPLVDVLRAAVSEIEQYQRIVVQTPPTATVQGRVASDVVHLLAELLDNATNFSPPSSQVVMTTNRTADGSIVVEISDRGVGMVPNELAEANTQLSGPTTVDLNVSRRMGLFVVGRLSNRHGIKVALSTSAGAVPDAGVTATIALPAELIPTSDPSETITRPAPRPVPAGAELAQAASNGNGVAAASLSALVAGTDGTASGSLFAVPATNGVPTAAPAPSLPSRRPGSTLNPGGPPRRPDDPAAQAAADQAAAREAEERLRARRTDGPSDVPPAEDTEVEQPAAAEEPEQEPQQPEEQPVERLGGAAIAGGATAFGAAAAFGRGTRAASEQNSERRETAESTPVPAQLTGATPAAAAAGQSTELPPAQPVEQPAEPSVEHASGAPAPLPRRTPGTGPTLAEQYGMGRYAPGRPEQPQAPESTGTTLPRRRPQQPQQQPQQAQPQQPGPEAYTGGVEQPRSAPRQFLAGLFGTGRPTGQNSPAEPGERPATGASTTGATPRPATPAADAVDLNSATTPLPLISRQPLPRLPEAQQGPQRPTGRPGASGPFGPSTAPAGPPANGAAAEHPAPAAEALGSPEQPESDGPRTETAPAEGPAAAATAADTTPAEDPAGEAQRTARLRAGSSPAEEPAAEAPEEASTDAAGADDAPAAQVESPQTESPQTESPEIESPQAAAPAADADARADGPAAAPAAQVGDVPVSPLPQRIPVRPSAQPPVAPAQRDGDANPTEALPLIGAGPVPAAPLPVPSPPAAPPPAVQQPAAAANGNEPAEPAAPAQPAAPVSGALFAESLPAPQVTPVPVGSDGPGIGETTPIFEEIASAWFRSNRSVPVTWDTDQPAPTNGTWQAPQPKPTPRPASTNGGNGFMQAPAPQQPPAATPSAAQPFQEQQPAFQEQQLASPADAGFASPADEGWRRADDVTSEGGEEVTSAGLPKRRPRARLVPGSAGSAVLAAPAAAARSNDNIRGRLSSYQRGVQQGRTGANRTDASDRFPGRPAPGDHDEESS